ncbi:MAG TPA: putative metalloprotease CJM1_0395 family protein, partial [Candidatus Competibacteraceae bacterium]|nr:putative metalloprotease CJM1_0395 family protein [Candidatus Competibacteraceae bacterium]
RDRQVRQHEMAHIAASGGLAQGGPSYAYQRGPDGQNYAIGGQVHLDISPGKTPEETLQKAQTIQAAAVAPAEPSGQDRAIAAKASQMAMQARLELNQQEGAEKNGLSQRDEDSPARRLAQRFLSAVTPQPEPFIQLAA